MKILYSNSHQLMTYTNQLVTDTNNQINEVDKCKERHLKIQRDRLVDEFTAALTAFQVCFCELFEDKQTTLTHPPTNVYRSLFLGRPAQNCGHREECLAAGAGR